MFGYQPIVSDNSGAIIASGQLGSAKANSDMMKQLGTDIGGALTSIGNMYGKYKDKKDMLAGMDQTMGAMADLGVLPKGFLNNYNSLDDNVRPFLFQALASPMFQAFQKKQGYQDYANAMKGVYGNGGGGGAPSPEFFEY